MSLIGPVNYLLNCHTQGTRSSIKEVYLCDISTSTVAAFTKALQTVCSDVKIQGKYLIFLSNIKSKAEHFYKNNADPSKLVSL